MYALELAQGMAQSALNTDLSCHPLPSERWVAEHAVLYAAANATDATIRNV